MTYSDWHLIRVALNQRINQLEDSHLLYSSECPGTGANSDRELCLLFKAVRKRVLGIDGYRATFKLTEVKDD